MDRRRQGRRPAEALKVCLCLLLVVLLTTGCTTMRPLGGDPAAFRGEIREGDRVRIVTRHGRTVELVVEAVGDAGISGEGKSIAPEEIAELEVREFSPGKTAGLVLGIVGLLALYVVAAIAVAQASFMGGL